MRKINRIRALSCCFLMSCTLLCGCPPAGTHKEGGQYTYVVHDINGESANVCEDHFYYIGPYGIVQFSFADQNATICMQRADFIGSIDAFAMSDEYVVFLVSPRETRTDPDELWKYDRMTKSFELFLEAEPDRICEIAIYNDFVIYGERGGKDFYTCPLKGNPKTDSISLRSLMEEENVQEPDVQKGIYQVQEVFYQGLRVLFFRESAGDDYRVLGILDAESKEIIWTNASNPLNHLGSVFWGEGEWIIFTRSPEGNFYQREGEADRHRFQCLDDPKYKAIGIAPSCLTMEGERLVGLMSTHNPLFGHFQYDQADEDNDILFEINLETNASEIIYETDKAQTRIIGYKNGVVYLLEDDVIYRGWIDRPEREKVHDLQEEGWELYTTDGKHVSVHFRWQGDNLIIQTGDEIRSIHISD